MSVYETGWRLLPAPGRDFVRRLAGYKRLRDIERELRDEGFPAVLIEPVRALAANSFPVEVEAVRSKVEALRDAALHKTDAVVVFPPPRPLQEVAWSVSIDRAHGAFLHMCAASIQAQSILELGVAIGIGSCYLALTPSCRSYIGIDASEGALSYARTHLASCVDPSRGQLIHGSFDEVLTDLYRDEALRFDFVWIDGTHTKEATIRDFERVMPRLNPGAIVAFDDVHLTPEMLETWDVLKRWPGFTHTIDVRRLGLGIWSGWGETPRHWDLARRLHWPMRLN
jgi:predicted O-methyltransferase YrrM